MHVQVDLNQGIAYLLEPHDTRQLLVVVSGDGGRADVDRVLGDAGSLSEDDADHAWLRVGWLREKGAATADGAWGERFDALLHDAAEHGLVIQDGALVRAHVEWTGAEELGEERD